VGLILSTFGRGRKKKKGDSPLLRKESPEQCPLSLFLPTKAEKGTATDTEWDLSSPQIPQASFGGGSHPGPLALLQSLYNPSPLPSILSELLASVSRKENNGSKACSVCVCVLL
jgi:hypothetical protein